MKGKRRQWLVRKEAGPSSRLACKRTRPERTTGERRLPARATRDDSSSSPNVLFLPRFSNPTLLASDLSEGLVVYGLSESTCSLCHGCCGCKYFTSTL